MTNSDSKRLRAVINALEAINVGVMAPSIARAASAAIDEYDQKKFVDGELEKFWSSDFEKETYLALARGLLAQAITRMTKFHEEWHKGKECDCFELHAITLGILK